MTKAAAAENIYARAAATWVARRFHLNADLVSGVDFATYRGGYCDTCAYETTGVSFKYYNQFREEEIGTTSAGQFIEECCEILAELTADGAVA